MSKVKSVLISIVFLIPALIVGAVLALILIKVDYGPDPGAEIGLTLWGVWALLCGFYFKSNRFKLAGTVLLVFAITELTVSTT